MPDLIRAVMGDEAVPFPGHLRDTYYDVFLRGEHSWLFEDLSNLIDLINYALKKLGNAGHLPRRLFFGRKEAGD